MLITRTSILSRIERTKEIDITPEQLEEYKRGNTLIQKIFPHLTEDEREFIMTGITSEEWDNAFKDDLDIKDIL